MNLKIIEKHLTLNRKSIGPDHATSIEPHTFEKMVLAIRRTEKYLGEEKKIITKSFKIKKWVIWNNSSYINSFLLGVTLLKIGDSSEMKIIPLPNTKRKEQRQKKKRKTNSLKYFESNKSTIGDSVTNLLHVKPSCLLIP